MGEKLIYTFDRQNNESSHIKPFGNSAQLSMCAEIHIMINIGISVVFCKYNKNTNVGEMIWLLYYSD